MQPVARFIIALALMALMSHWVRAQDSQTARMVDIEIPQVDGLPVYPTEGDTSGNQTYWVARLGGSSNRHGLFQVTDKGLVPVTLEGSSPVLGEVLRLVSRTPYVYRKQGNQSDYLEVTGATAKVVKFDGEFKAGAYGQHFCTPARELLWDKPKDTLYFITNGEAKAVKQQELSGVISLDACKTSDGFLLIEPLVAASRAPKAWLLDHDLKLRELAFEGLSALDTLQLFTAADTPYLLAGTPKSGTIFKFEGGKLAALVDEQKRPVSGVPWMSVAASDTTMFLVRDSRGDELELWCIRGRNQCERVKDRQGRSIGNVRINLQSNSGDAALVQDVASRERTWFVRGVVATPLVDAEGNPFSDFDHALTGTHAVWLLHTDARSKSVSLYHADKTGTVRAARLPDGELAVADIATKRTSGGAGILEGMEIAGDGKANYCRRWTATGCRLYALTD